MSDKRVHDRFDQLINELIEMTGKTMERQSRPLSPCCDAPSVEIFSTVAPCGYTGIYKCLICGSCFDPTMPEVTP